MLVRDGPSPFDFAQSDRQAKIQAFGFAVYSRFSAAHGCHDKGDSLLAVMLMLVTSKETGSLDQEKKVFHVCRWASCRGIETAAGRRT